ncbi:hypothetical protein NDU88_006925 [Pleurodeles waltl]|uniref:Uncharacterized protein n=1 Tax=Pleurodeles waltl TaxID=8319 RepID=A0AAV7NZI3_PLEWA|nr:hypothetical protein NDU88_006925 [Pleurodeles waltl]
MPPRGHLPCQLRHAALGKPRLYNAGLKTRILRWGRRRLCALTEPAGAHPGGAAESACTEKIAGPTPTRLPARPPRAHP